MIIIHDLHYCCYYWRGVSRHWPDIFLLQTIVLAVGQRMGWLGIRIEVRRWIQDHCRALVRREGLTCVGGGVVAFDTDTNEDFGAVALNPNCTYESFEELFKKKFCLPFLGATWEPASFHHKGWEPRSQGWTWRTWWGRCGEVKKREVSCMATRFLK